MTDSNPRQNVTFPSNGGEAHGYLKTPTADSGPGLVVIQEWWGLDDHVADLVDRFAGEGFVTLAPDLYGGRVAHDADTAGEMHAASCRWTRRCATSPAPWTTCSACPRSRASTVGTVGYCMGGGVRAEARRRGRRQDRRRGAVLRRRPGRAGRVPHRHRARSRATTASRTRCIPSTRPGSSSSRSAQESQAPVEFFYYPAGHAFHNDRDKLGTYDPQSATLAWNRTLEFLRAHLA